MYPWFWFWQPNLHFPLSGSVTQDLAPDVISARFFNAIPHGAGEGELEKKIFDYASYGKQIGWLTDMLLASAGSEKVSADDAAKARKAIEALHDEVERIKSEYRDGLLAEAHSALDALKSSDSESLERLLSEYRQAAKKP